VKIRNIRFVGNLILNTHITFLSDDVIIVTSSHNVCYFSPSVYYRNSELSIRMIAKYEEA